MRGRDGASRWALVVVGLLLVQVLLIDVHDIVWHSRDDSAESLLTLALLALVLVAPFYAKELSLGFRGVAALLVLAATVDALLTRRPVLPALPGVALLVAAVFVPAPPENWDRPRWLDGLLLATALATAVGYLVL